MKNLLLLFTILTCTICFSQIETTEQQYNTFTSCLSSFKLQGQINNYDEDNIYSLKLLEAGQTEYSSSISIQNFINSDGSFTTNRISISSTTDVTLWSTETIIVGGIFPIKIPVPTTQVIKIIKCQDDIDSDGVLNNIDICENIYGNSSNFGCPGNPDFAIRKSETKQISSCYDCNSYLNNVNSTSLRPVIYRYGGNMTITPLVIENIGDGDTHIGSIRVNFYISEDDKLSDDDLGFSYRYLTSTPPKAGEATYNGLVGSPKLEVSIEGTDIGDNIEYGDYYLLITIDDTNTLLDSELKTDNNIVAVPFTYSATLPSSKFFNLKDNLLSITDIYGNPVLSNRVNNTLEDEKSIIEDLPSGLYIINNTNGESRKILKK